MAAAKTTVAAPTPPTIAQPINVGGSGTLTGRTAALTVLGANAAGEASLNYTWSVVTSPTGATIGFSVNGTNAAKYTTATFTLTGTYTVSVKIVDGAGLSVTTTKTLVVTPTLTSIKVSPNTASVLQGATQQFTAAALDQFGQPMANQQLFTWTATGGTITAAGLFTASTTAASGTVTVKSGTVTGTAAVTLQANTGKFQDPALAKLIQSLDADGSISRADMIQILRSVAAGGALSTADFSDLKQLLAQAKTYNIPAYVQALAADVVNGNAANATYQGQTLGNLSPGSSATQLTNLINKWFYGTDHPTLCNTSLVYTATAGSLFPHTPSHTDEVQGILGDCYFISAMGTLADSNPAAVKNMFIDNGDGTFTLRFYTGTYGVNTSGYSGGAISAGFQNNQVAADYITVDRCLPAGSSGILAYADYGASVTNAANALWIPLAEKAYAQWNQTGKAGRDNTNAYASIQGGWMATVDAQVLGYNAYDYIMTGTSEQIAVAPWPPRRP